MQRDIILKKIETASKVIGKTWPLYSFVTSNPLSGYENKHFKQAMLEVEQLNGGHLFPSVAAFSKAWKEGEIDTAELTTLLRENGIDLSPAESLSLLESQPVESKNPFHEIDRRVIKWLMTFMDEGLSEWSMPNKEEGFYKAWKTLARYDKEFPFKYCASLTDNSPDVLYELLRNLPEADHVKIFEQHLAALPGWAGYIKYRSEANSEWQKKYPITLADYLAVRLQIAKVLNVNLLNGETNCYKKANIRDIQYLWLKAWEQSWQQKMSDKLSKTFQKIEENLSAGKDSPIPEAQLVFCIDTRSELIRRHVESNGTYETFGYAGFFGLAMDYESLSDGLVKKTCPPILASTYKVSEKPNNISLHEINDYHKRQDRKRFAHYFLKRMKHMLPSAFGYVEGSGLFYGIALLLRTVFAEKLYEAKKRKRNSFESICQPHIQSIHDSSSSAEISVAEKTAIVKSAFELMGWKNFSPLVVFVGHGSHSANNPFGSSLDCGACAASPGRHNARMLAKLANQFEVREALKTFHITIPSTTLFVGAEHNTTTDEIVLFDDELPDSHINHLSKLKKDLYLAQRAATSERLGTAKNGIAVANMKSNDWSETRPEWGLAKNAGFIIGPRSLTKALNLKGNCFLHSYDWELDTGGNALEGIMQGPMVVTQWINNHYYFSTVDNENYGGGSKITHNVTGRFGVMQGNGGDLKRGLPLQSVNESDQTYYHRPLRLTVYIHAPKQRIVAILQKHENLKSLIDNEWIYLKMIDPTNANKVSAYEEKSPLKTAKKDLVQIYD